MTASTSMLTDEHAEHMEPKINPIPVVLVQDHPLEEQNLAPDFGSYNTYILLGTETQPLNILPQSRLRNRAVIRVTSLVPTANAYVTIGGLGQVGNGTPQTAQGFRLFHSQVLEIESMPAVYMLPDGTNPVTVCVMDEKYLSTVHQMSSKE